MNTQPLSVSEETLKSIMDQITYQNVLFDQLAARTISPASVLIILGIGALIAIFFTATCSWVNKRKAR